MAARAAGWIGMSLELARAHRTRERLRLLEDWPEQTAEHGYLIPQVFGHRSTSFGRGSKPRHGVDTHDELVKGRR
jgi:hypothetical protein